jgi:GTPase Era involved in 16S rRNA processing
LRSASNQPTLITIVGGTGTGKSTLVNTLLDANITATNFRRTFTDGALANAKSPESIP